jgi:hypothetical protein
MDTRVVSTLCMYVCMYSRVANYVRYVCTVCMYSRVAHYLSTLKQERCIIRPMIRILRCFIHIICPIISIYT